MASLLDHGALMEYNDLITETAGGQPVADIDCSTIPNDFFLYKSENITMKWQALPPITNK